MDKESKLLRSLIGFERKCYITHIKLKTEGILGEKVGTAKKKEREAVPCLARGILKNTGCREYLNKF